MEYKLLKARGALQEQEISGTPRLQAAVSRINLDTLTVPLAVVQLVPESVARENLVLPIAFDGETLTCAAADPENISLADKLRFLLSKDVRLIAAPADALRRAIHRHYGQTETASVDSMLCEFTDSEQMQRPASSIDVEARTAPRSAAWAAPGRARHAGRVWNQTQPAQSAESTDGQPRRKGYDPMARGRRGGMFFYTVDEGEQVLMRRPNGTMEVIVGPQRVWRLWRTFQPMEHYVAGPDQFLIVRYRDGRQQHLSGPTHLWFDPRVHLEVRAEDVLQLAAKEAVVAYSKDETGTISRRIVHGPALFVPQPGEWLHTFSWHASRGGSRGAAKVPNALVFQKLWLLPDQMYHDVGDVRTADDAVLTIRLMIFFELLDIERMLDTTHDPIGDFVNAATSDVVEFTSKHTFESFKRGTEHLNELETYRQLTGRAAQCGYRINKVVYRGYGTAESLQQMHDHAIEARTKLQLERATEQQAQDLENYKLDSQLARAGKRRGEQTIEVTHDLELAERKQAVELRQREARAAQARQMRQQEGELQLELRRRQDAAQREHLTALRELGVDLTAYLTQARADRVIELRGGGSPHVHLEAVPANGPAAGNGGRPANNP